jgi:hypothetical protein
MRINYESFPALKFIENKSISNARYFDLVGNKISSINKGREEFKDFYESEFVRVCNNFTHTPIIIANPFMNAILRKDVFAKLQDIIYDVPVGSGTFIIPEGEVFIYEIKQLEGFKEFTIFCFARAVFVGFYRVAFTEKYNDHSHLANFTSIEGDYWQLEFIRICTICLFKKYAPTEERFLIKNSGNTFFNCKYVNNTNKNLKVLDSLWFTTLIQSEGFNVRGHFRLQPKKHEGKWTRELIWIDEFQKKGYVRLAGKLTQ